MKRLLLGVVAVLLSVASYAQTSDTLLVKRDSVQTETKRDTIPPTPVRPVPTLGKESVIDTLATENPALSIILYNNNTWRYVLSADYVRDTTVFSKHWNTATTNPYYGISAEQLPEATAIELVDS